MKTFIATAAVLAIVASAADATPKHHNNSGDRTYNNNTNKNYNTNNNHQGQAQGQFQGQGQSQSAAAAAAAIAASNATGGNATGGNSDQSQTQSSSSAVTNQSSGNVTVEGSISGSISGAACTNGFNIGGLGIGGFIGMSLSDNECKIMQEVAALHAMGRTDLALSHMTNIPRFAATIRAAQAPSAPSVGTSVPTHANGITDQTYYGGKAGPVARAYTDCRYVNGQLMFAPAGNQAAMDACREADKAGLIR